MIMEHMLLKDNTNRFGVADVLLYENAGQLLKK